MQVFNWPDIRKIEARRFILWVPFIYGAGCALGLGPLCDLNLKYIIFSQIFFIILFFISIIKNENQSFFRDIFQFLLLCCFILLLGILGAIKRTNDVSSPLIEKAQIYNNLYGKITNISRSYDGNWRAKISVFSINGIHQKALPKYVRINIDGLKPDKVGDFIKCNAFIAPPDLQIHPFAYDFARDAWFEKIGGIGRCQTNIEYIKNNNSNNFKQWLEIKRSQISQQISGEIIGGGKGFLAAISTGDRSYISKADMEALQISGLGHIVSVSGLHVGLVAGIVFLVFKKFFALFPFIALRFDTRKIAAILAFICILYYTFFTGAEAPALRALIMAGVMMAGILINRKAISMRGLVVAALVLLIINPENALDAGFLMSFLATMALVALWEYGEIKQFLKPRNPIETILFWIFGAALTSFVAGIATIPISLVNFQTLNTYGLFANLISAPISDFIVAPAAIIGFTLKPIGIGKFFLEIAAWGLEIILKIGYFFANLSYSNLFLDNFTILSATFMVFGFIWFCIFTSRLRLFAFLPLLLSFITWIFAPKTIAIFSSNAGSMINLKESKNDIITLCFVPRQKYNAKRLINSSNIKMDIKKSEIANIENLYSKMCNLNGGNWEAHFIKNNDFKNEYIISLTIEGKTYALNHLNIPIGARLIEKNGKPILIIPPIKAKWQIAQIENMKNNKINNDDIKKPKPLEP